MVWRETLCELLERFVIQRQGHFRIDSPASGTFLPTDLFL